MSAEQKIALAEYVGRALKVIHQLPYYYESHAERSKDLEVAWGDWDTYLKELHMKCYKRHKKEKVKLSAFLPLLTTLGFKRVLTSRNLFLPSP